MSSRPADHHNMERDDRTEINPADYFNPDLPCPEPALFRKLWFPTVLGAGGVGAACFSNAMNRKPLFSGLQIHVLLASAGVIAGIIGGRWLQNRAAERDHILYHYILAHPEDFPPIQRKKYADVLQKWIPIR
ncbi:NADH dehydrogenase [ubiquinone] 1 subunit C2 [Procambarus clarkii]|uniref:NADH dehydrogenase [ubiquinone] 1 subunit C2 n=1 Tax=Procambarus clarkii TaxID=6728 RepID=UPI001E673C34|nr:NADH dehydrogenase [ubiquinone] 1 subunit C2-like [Procambarus clarkii]